MAGNDAEYPGAHQKGEFRHMRYETADISFKAFHKKNLLHWISSVSL